MSGQYFRQNPSGTIPQEHELLPIWRAYNANPTTEFSTTKIVAEAQTLTPFEKDHFRANLIAFEQVPNKREGWYDSVYGQCPRS